MLLLAATPASAQSSNLYVGGGSATVDFVDTISGDDTQPTVQLGFNGSGAFNSFTMDTGSVGILASSQYFTPGPDAKWLGEGSQYYSSDHRTEYGVWWEATQQIYSNGVLVAEAKVPVLQVTHAKHCDANGDNCTWNYSPDVHMMGVGFAREGAVGQTDPGTARSTTRSSTSPRWRSRRVVRSWRCRPTGTTAMSSRGTTSSSA